MDTRRLPSAPAARRGVALLLLTAAFLLGLPAAGGAAPRPIMAPPNPAYVKAVNALDFLQPACSRQLQAPLHLGYIPDPVLAHHGPLTRLPAEADEAPVSYDLRDHGKLTAVHDQGNHGTCWAFATMGALESSLLPRQHTNLSEDNLVNYSGFFDAAGRYDSGGLYSMSLAYLLRQSGPKWEQADAYPTPELTSGARTQKWVRDVWLIPPRGDDEWDDIVKWAIMTEGAIGTDLCWDSDSYNPDTAAFYYAGSEESNHAVCIVGWDDTFPRTSFLPVRQPPGDGAWLMRNSWGRTFGDGGYFWISYHDTTMGSDNNLVFTRVVDPDRRFRLYGHDRLGLTNTMGFAGNVAADTGWMASAFKARGTERPASAGFYMVSGGKATIYTGRSKSTLRKAATKTISMPGYYTVPLDSTLRLRKGERFVVAVRISTPGYAFPIPLQAPLEGFADTTARPGMSWVSPDGQRWTDATKLQPGTAVCLKAITKR